MEINTFTKKTRVSLEHLQTAILETQKLAQQNTDPQLKKDLDDCQILFYQFRRLIDDTNSTHSRLKTKISDQEKITASFQNDINQLRQSAFSYWETNGKKVIVQAPVLSDENRFAIFGQVDLAATQLLGLVPSSQGSLKPDGIRRLVSALANFEQDLSKKRDRLKGDQFEPLLANIAVGAANMRNSLVDSLIQSLRLESLQNSRTKIGDTFIVRIGQISDRCRNELTTRMAKETQELLGLSIVIGVSCALLVVGAILLTILLSRSLVRAIVEVSTVAEAMAGGNLNVSLRVRKNDEIGRMAHSLNKTIAILRKLIEDLSQARDRAISAEKAKGQFLANMGHEIRTPMNVILGLTGMLLESSLSNDQREDLIMIQSSARNLLEILNDILDASKIEAGQMRLTSAPMELRKLIAHCVDLYRNQAQSKGVNLSYRIANEIPEVLMADEGKLRQITTNLISNALKFTAHGKIELVVVLSQENTNKQLVPNGEPVKIQFSIQDTGIGIDHSIIPQLFKPFVQADGSIQRKYGGSGLGLAISKQLCEMMGGSIVVTSELGVGSVFRFDILAEIASELTLTQNHVHLMDRMQTERS